MNIIFNFTNIGKYISGLGRYSKSILENLSKSKVNYSATIKVYLNRSVLNEVQDFKNLKILLAPSFISPDLGFKGHLARLLWTNYLALRERNAIIFNPSQLEGILIKHKSNKIITVIHDLIPLLFKRGKLYYYFKYFLPKVIYNSDRIIVVSKHTKELLLRYYRKIPEDKIYVIYNGVSRYFKFLNLEKKPYILYVGRFDKLKNIERLLKSFFILVKDYQLDYNLVFVGNGNLDDNWFEHSIKNRITILRNIDDNKLLKLYNEASLFVFPSLYEGFGLPPLEAMACGCPVVVSNVASLPEICGDAAYYVNPYHVEDIVRGIYTILKDKNLQKELIKKGLERVKLFRWEKSAKRLLQIIEGIV